MATVAYGDTFNVTQYFGEVFQAVPLQAPFLASLAGQQAGAVKLPSPEDVQGLRVCWTLEPERGVTNQTGVVESGTPTVRTNVFTQEYNVIQDFQESFMLSYARLGASNYEYNATIWNAAGPTPSGFDKQMFSLVKSVAKAIDYSMFRNTRAMPGNNSSARAMGGLYTLGSTNAKNYETTDMDKATFLAHLASSYDNGALRGSGRYACFCSSTVKAKISELLGLATYRVLPVTSMANVNVTSVETDFGILDLILSPNQPTYSYIIADLSEMGLYGLNVPGKGNFFVEELGRLGSYIQYQLWGNVTLKFGHEYHLIVGKNIGGTSA
jgi:hypothetical protein